MSFSFASMIRLLALGAVGLTMLAVGVSRLVPPGVARRFDAPVTTISINDHLLGVPDRQPRWLDATKGTVELTPLAGDDVLEAASCSPWVDAQGRRQVVGRWSSRSLDGTQTVANAFGIARFSFPDGRPIDQISLEHFPVSPPCWLPGDRARVLFVAGDGQLRRFDFEPSGATDEPEPSGVTEARASLVSWACPQPGAGEVYFGEVAWPRLPDVRLRGLVLATLRFKLEDRGQGTSLSSSELWWLRLDPDFSQITAAGPLLERGPGGPTVRPSDERTPTLAVLPDGSIGLAFARSVPESSTWSVCLGTVEVQADGRPSCREATVRVLDVRDRPGPLAFSPDGRWLNTLVVGPREAAAVQRLRTTADALTRLDPVAPVR